MTPIKSYKIEIGEVAKLNVYLVGAGGTGSFTALHLARLAYVAKQKGIDIRLAFIDPDVVEIGNVGRQNFVEAELGQPKAVTLARRYSYAFGLQIESRVDKFQAGMVQSNYRELSLVIGCVDNAAARRELATVKYRKGIWWLDSGNDKFSGQVMIGNGQKVEIDATGFCTAVPRPDVQWPELLRDPAPEKPAKNGRTPPAEALSCAQLLAMEAQSLMINQAMAGIVGTYAFRLLMARDLDLQKTYVNLESLSMRSEAITGEVGRIEPAKVEKPVRIGNGQQQLWTDEEILVIQDGVCPVCAGNLVEGRDVTGRLVDRDVEENIVFCPECRWQITEDEVLTRLEDIREAEEYQETIDGFYGPAEEEEELEGVP